MAQIRIPNNWNPRSYQMNAWNYLENGGKRAYLVWHRRSGKDDLCLHRTAVAALQRVGSYWHMLPEASQARKAIWDAINPHTGKKRIDEAFPKEIRKRTVDNEMKIEFINGSMWQLVGSDNYDSLVGSAPCGVVFSEWALANPSAWAYLRPILAENNGWALFITTPRGRNHAAKFFEFAKTDPEWFCERLTVNETGVFSGPVLESERRELISQFGEDEGNSKFEQEYLCSFDAALQGAYYGSEMAKAEQEKRITNVPYDPAFPVITAWDLGYGDSTAIWFAQVVGREPRVIDYYEANNQSLEHYAKLIKEKGYNYENHFLPHDAAAGELGTGKTISQLMRDLGIKNTVLARADIDAGIQQGRQLIPKLWFDEKKCFKGVEALRNYQRKWDEVRKVYSPRPMHNWASHGADAFRYLAVALAETRSTGQFKGPGSSNPYQGIY